MAMNEQQRYLLGRIPKMYSWKSNESVDPSDVAKARKIIASYEEKQSKRRVAQKEKLENLINSAHEAVYFKPADEALKIVKAVEVEFAKGICE